MKYTRNCLDRALSILVPNIMQLKVIEIRLPEMLKLAAVDCFVNKKDDTDNLDIVFSCYLVRIALKELMENSFIEYGTIDEFWGSSKTALSASEVEEETK